MPEIKPGPPPGADTTRTTLAVTLAPEVVAWLEGQELPHEAHAGETLLRLLNAAIWADFSG